MIVYRVEDPWTRLGPYHGGPGAKLLTTLSYTWNSDSHPTPDFDDIRVPHRPDGQWPAEWRCGFRSLRQLVQWFPKRYRYHLAEAGLVVARWDAHLVRSGRHQVLYHHPTAVRLDHFPVCRIDTLTSGAELANVRI